MELFKTHKGMTASMGWVAANANTSITRTNRKSIYWQVNSNFKCIKVEAVKLKNDQINRSPLQPSHSCNPKIIPIAL
jgi:hypothetical protein